MKRDPKGFKEKENTGRKQRRGEEMKQDPDGFKEKEMTLEDKLDREILKY